MVHFWNMSLVFSTFPILFVLVSAYDKGNHGLNDPVESFQYGDYYFNFYYAEANWDEAYAVCKAASSRLAVVHNMERANFLAETLTYTRYGVEDIWIGARFVADHWQWIPSKSLLPIAPENGFPPWLHYPTKRGKYCLSLDRKNHSEPLFVELECFLQRPFICEKSSVAQLTVKPTLTTKIKVNMSMYSVYYGRVTWEESLTFCLHDGGRLAVIPNIEIANQLVAIMQHLRPAIRNAWIGARRQNDGWIWTATEERLPSEKDLETEYPPWAYDDYETNQVFKDCLVLDHHICKSIKIQGTHGIETNCHEKSIFLADRCMLKKDFICESVPPQNKSPPNETDVVMAGPIKYIYSRQRQPWKSAVEVCSSLNMVLAMPRNEKELYTIVSNLADVEYAWDHIWLGAKWNVTSGHWEWLNKTKISINESYLPWCKSMPEHEDQENCLNLDRDAHKIPIVYGFNCSISQGFVCQFIAEEGPTLPDISELRAFVINDQKLSHANAEEVCESYKSHLAIVNTMELAQNLSLVLPVDTPVWVGGKRINSIWQWMRTKETIPDMPDDDNYPPWSVTYTKEGEVCLAMQSGFRRYPQFIEMLCNATLASACEHGTDGLPEPDEVVSHHDNTYYFFRHQETWPQANSFCTLSHLHLVKIGSLELANFLSEITGDEHPWWVAAKREPNDTWQWTSTGEKISDKVMNALQFNTNNSVNEDTKCLILLDATSKIKFTEENCDEKHGFICVNYNNVQHRHSTTNKHGIIFDIKQNLANLINSKKYCEEQGMAVMNLTNNIKVTIAIMHEKKIKSLWMDITRTDKGKWVYEDSKEEFYSKIKFPRKDEKDVRKDCAMLILIRNQPQIRRSDCNDFSFMLCQKDVPKTEKGEINLEQFEMGITSPPSTQLKLIASLEGRAFSQAKEFCEDLGGSLIDENHAEAYKASPTFVVSLSQNFTQFWTGKNVTDNKSEIKKRAQHLQKRNNLCVAYIREEKEYRNMDCNTKLSTMCYLDLTPCAALTVTEDLKWSPQSCMANGMAGGRVCKATCQNGYLFGPEKLVCVKGNWTYRSSFVNNSKCLSNSDQSRILLEFLKSKVITETKPKIPFLFVIDSGAPRFLFDVSISLVKHIVNVILLAERRQTSIIVYSKYAKTAIDFFTYDTCDFTEKLKFLSRDNHSPTANYFKAFDSIDNLLKKQNFNQIILIFFALRKDMGPMTERISMIQQLQKRGVIIVVFAVKNNMDRTSLETMASVYNGDLQLYLFKNEKALKDCGNFLKQHRNSAVDTCIFDKKPRP